MRWLACVVLVAACTPRGASTPEWPAGAGCPTASGVYVASFVHNPGRTGWVLPLHAMAIEPTAKVPEWVAVDATTASVSGVPAAPEGPLWLFTATGPPCRAHLGSYYAARMPGPPASVSYGVELDGCMPPDDPQDDGGLVLASPELPAGCEVETPRPVAERLGQIDAQKLWHRPSQSTPIPPAVAALVPAHDCRAPDCETLWAFAQEDLGDQAIAWSGAVNWLHVTDPSDQCTWHAERWSGIFLPGPGGTLVQLETGDHPLALAAMLVDRGGPKVVLADGPGTYATYDVAWPQKPVRSITWMLAPHEAWDAVDRLGPPCNRPPVAPAPLPKNARPLSPY